MAVVTFTETKIAQGQPPISGGQAGVVVCNEGEYEVPATLAVTDVVKLAYLPANHEPVDVILESDDLDGHGTPTMVLDVGVVDSAGTALVASTKVISASAVGKAGGVARADTVAGLELAASDSDRVLGVKITTAAATPAAGTLRLKVLSKPA